MSNSPLESLKQAFLIPLENNLKRIKSIPLGNFKSSSDMDKQVGIIMGLEDCLGHFNSVYEAVSQKENPSSPLSPEIITVDENDVEIIPPTQG